MLARLWFAFSLLLSLLLLNFALSFHNSWPTPWITSRAELSAEIAVMLLVLSLYSEWRGVPHRRWLYALTIVMLTLTIGRYAEVTAPALFGRRINLYWDGQHIPKVAAMFAQSAAWPSLVGAMLGVFALLVAIFAALWLSLRQVWCALGTPVARRTLLALSALLVASWLFALSTPGKSWLHWFSLPVTDTYAQQARFIHQALSGTRVAANLEAAPLPEANFARIAGADAMLMFMESYGATSFDEADLRSALRASMTTLAQSISANNLQVASTFVTSPTFGGASWLAHSSLMSGIAIEDARSYSMLLTRNRDTLAHRFSQRGYRTIALMPGLKQAWPEGEFYGFAHIYGEKALDWQGPDFGWWRIPDQYSLARIESLEFQRRDRAPLFVFFPTISTHLPFQPTPPYQQHWSRLLSESPFDSDAVRSSLAGTANWSNPRADYAQAMNYALKTLAGYLHARNNAGPGTRDLILVLVGDHQPPASVSGKMATRDVPVHIISARSELIDALIGQGFVHGLQPKRAPLMPMHQLAPLLLRLFSSPSGLS